MKVNVAVIFGGKSVEHEISVISALQALEYIDKNKYRVIPIYITKQGSMYTGEAVANIESYQDINAMLNPYTTPVTEEMTHIMKAESYAT